jgi:LuxR family maltose regulon positive regulatory protein
LVVVGAPAGSGKTSAVAEWVRELPGEVVWSRGTTPGATCAWDALLGGLARAGVPVGDIGGAHSRQRIVRLATQVAQAPKPVTVVLDGFEINEAAVAAQVEFLIRQAGSRLRVVITSRGDPIVPTESRTPGLRLELRQDELAFTDAEAEELFDALGVAVDGAEVRRINRILRGWPVGLHLTARVLGADGPSLRSAATAVRHASGINEYLLSEVLDAQAPDVRRFLLATSALEGLTPVSVHRVAGPEGVHILAGIQRLNVFLEALPEEPGRYRYPPFFRDLLRTQLSYESRIPPAPVAALRVPAQRASPDESPPRSVVSVPGPAGEDLLIESLTPKELEVLGHLQELLTTEEIADNMFVSVNTVRTHVRNILRKLGVTRRYAAVRRARELGLVAADR